jgi:hypothetical protein
VAFAGWSVADFEIIGHDTLQHLAMDEHVWDEGHYMHGGARTSLKRCSPAGMVQQLSALDTLTIVGRSGLWRDGNELIDSCCYFRED